MLYGSTPALGQEALAQEHPDLYDALAPLLREGPSALDAYLETVACNVAIVGTQTEAHCYFVALDGNKRPRVRDFARFIAYRIANFAIPRGEVARAQREGLRTGSAAPMAALNDKAKRLFARVPASGEGGEVLLSILAEALLRLPQLFTKMVLKTSTDMHVHGCDGIHVGVDTDTGNLAIYWGESKLYRDAASAVRECFKSLAPFLLGAGGSGAAQEQDLRLMRDNLALDDPELTAALKRYLDPDDPHFKKLVYRGLCLVGFDSDAYPTAPNARETQAVKADIEAAFERYKAQVLNRVTDEQIGRFVIEVFCLPFPSVGEFRAAFRRELGLDVDQS